MACSLQFEMGQKFKLHRALKIINLPTTRYIDSFRQFSFRESLVPRVTRVKPDETIDQTKHMTSLIKRQLPIIIAMKFCEQFSKRRVYLLTHPSLIYLQTSCPRHYLRLTSSHSNILRGWKFYCLGDKKVSLQTLRKATPTWKLENSIDWKPTFRCSIKVFNLQLTRFRYSFSTDDFTPFLLCSDES